MMLFAPLTFGLCLLAVRLPIDIARGAVLALVANTSTTQVSDLVTCLSNWHCLLECECETQTASET